MNCRDITKSMKLIKFLHKSLNKILDEKPNSQSMKTALYCKKNIEKQLKENEFFFMETIRYQTQKQLKLIFGEKLSDDPYFKENETIPPLPEEFSAEAISELEKVGFAPIYMPNIDIKKLAVGETQFVFDYFVENIQHVAELEEDKFLLKNFKANADYTNFGGKWLLYDLRQVPGTTDADEDAGFTPEFLPRNNVMQEALFERRQRVLEEYPLVYKTGPHRLNNLSSEMYCSWQDAWDVAGAYTKKMSELNPIFSGITFRPQRIAEAYLGANFASDLSQADLKKRFKACPFFAKNEDCASLELCAEKALATPVLLNRWNFENFSDSFKVGVPAPSRKTDRAYCWTFRLVAEVSKPGYSFEDSGKNDRPVEMEGIKKKQYGAGFYSSIGKKGRGV